MKLFKILEDETNMKQNWLLVSEEPRKDMSQ